MEVNSTNDPPNGSPLKDLTGDVSTGPTLTGPPVVTDQISADTILQDPLAVTNDLTTGSMPPIGNTLLVNEVMKKLSIPSDEDALASAPHPSKGTEAAP